MGRSCRQAHLIPGHFRLARYILSHTGDARTFRTASILDALIGFLLVPAMAAAADRSCLRRTRMRQGLSARTRTRIDVVGQGGGGGQRSPIREVAESRGGQGKPRVRRRKPGPPGHIRWLVWGYCWSW